jgi:hypothetical protein
LSDPWSDVTTHLAVKTEDAPPYRILSADLSPPRVREAGIHPFASERAMLMLVKRRVRDQARARRFSGVVLLGRGDTVIDTIVSPDVRKLYPDCAPASLRFNLASMGKLLTATAVMQQVWLSGPAGRHAVLASPTRSARGAWRCKISCSARSSSGASGRLIHIRR